MRYENWQFLWPPRPDKAGSKSLLPFYESEGWVAQFKMNGTCNVMASAPDRDVVKAMSRHREEHKAWAPSVKTAKAFQNLPGNGWYVFTAELMHSKVAGIRDINYIHDILVADGEHLIGTTFAARQELLASIFNVNRNTKVTKKNPISHITIDEHTWLARNHYGDFSNLFEGIDAPELEGLVLKDPTATLAPCLREKSNTGWLAKVRAPSKNFNF